MMESTKHYSSIQEKRVADLLGWKVVSGSGARDCHPGDIISEMWLGECKTHTSPGHKIEFKRSVWDKICKEAQAKFKYPVLIVDDGSQSVNKTWCLFPFKVVDCPASSICELNLAVRSNVVFDHNTQIQNYRAMQDRENKDNVILSVDLGQDRLGVVPLDIFNSMFGDNT